MSEAPTSPVAPLAGSTWQVVTTAQGSQWQRVAKTAADAEALRREWAMRKQWAGLSAWLAPVELQEQGDTCRLLYAEGDCQPLSVLGKEKTDIAQALRLFQSAAEALVALHRSGWLQMRGCPDDWVLVDGQLRLSGLGWAMPLTQASPQPDWLADTARLPWLAPELSGRLGAAPDTRTDLYTLGALLYAHLTGVPPLQGADSMETLHAILARAPQPAHLVRPDIPLPLSDLLGSLLAKHPQDRPASAEALLAQLRALDTPAAPLPAPVPARLQFAKRLVGRTAALDQLKAAWKAARAGSSQIVLLEGQQGVGKSALAQALGALATAEGGHFLAGKFTQYNRASPYIGLYEALNSALNRLLTLDEASLQAKRAAIATALGDNAAALAQFLPGLTWLLGMHLRGTHEEGSETVNRRLKRAFRAFIAEFASAERPLVLVLEDVQWAAGPSFQLLQTLLESGGLPHFVLILSYRAEEQAGQLDWLEFYAALPRDIAVTHLHLQALDTTECAHWLAETLELSVAEVTALARVLHQKTGGNPLFLRELLGRIHRAQLLYRAADSGQWNWKLEAIQGIETAGGSAALIAEQLRQIPAPEADILFKAAVLGGEIEPSKLNLYFGFTLPVLQQSLDGAVDQGILLPPSEPGLPYRFAHELLQKAAYELADPATRSAAHHTIALVAMAASPAEGMDAHALLYHWNQCLDRLDSADLRRRFAALSLEAVQKDRAAVAFDRAYTTLITAKQQLTGLSDPAAMELRGSIDLALYEAMAFTGRDAESNQLHQDALRTYADQLLHVRLHLAKARVHIARSELIETLHSCKAGLALVGIRLPVKGSTFGVVIEFLRTQWVLLGKRAEDLKDLPTWDSPVAEFLSELMYLSLHPAYVQDPTLFAILSLKALQMTVRKGVGRNSYLGFSTYSSFLAVGFDDFKRAWAYAHVGDRIAERLGNRFFMVYAARAFSQTYGQPLRNAFQWSELAHQKADHASLLREASEPLPLDAMARYHAGLTLTEVEKTISGYLVYIQKAGTQHLYDSVLVAMIGIRRLRGTAIDDLQDIHGQAIDAGRLRSILYDTNYLTIRAYHQLFELQRLALLGDMEAAAALLPDLRAIQHSVAGAFTMTEIIFTEAWVMGMLGRSRRGWAGLRARMRCTRLLRKIRKWALSAPDNFQHKVLLLEGVLEPDSDKAIRRLEAAAAAARQSEFAMHEALATELAGMRSLEAGKEAQATAHLQAAEAKYAAWGATVKSQVMRLRFPGYFPPTPKQVETGAALSGRLDLSSLLKASRTISSEISLSGLLSRLIRIMTEYAGAERGLLLIEEDGQLLIQARSEGGNAEVFILEGSPARASDRLSQRILNVVARRHEALVLSDASLSNEFADDPYVLQQRPKSILCLPILNQSQLSGILYLENNLAAAAFSHERVEVLDTLAAQAAVSLANARLYLSLEARVEERTQALQTALEGLRATQDQLVQSEKLASLGQVTAGIAHEIRNPLNFITNFSELSEELIEELVESIKTLNTDQVSGEIKTEWVALLQDIQQNAAKIRHHGKRAEAIVRNMLLHAASGSGERQALDLNALAKEYLLLAYHGMRGTSKGFQCQLEDQLDPRVAPIQVVQQDISRALLNIFHNAFQAMEEKARTAPAGYQPRLLLRTVELGHAVELHIRDNGPGIPQAIQEQIFDPFFTTKPTGKGTGLGLSLTFDLIVQGHGGQIRVESEPDAWTEFILTLPRR